MERADKKTKDFRAVLIPNINASCGGEKSCFIIDEVIASVKARLERLSVDVTLSNGCFPDNIDAHLIKNSDVVIALGGDGTIIHIAKCAAEFGKPVLGINCGNLGFMAAIEHDELDKLDKIIGFLKGAETKDSQEDGAVYFQKRMMINVALERENGEREEFTGLNEMTLSRDATARMITFEVSNSRERVISYHADGVIVASPTGSTAYSLSAGGPIVDPDVECMIVNPICPHALFARAYIFSADDVITIKIQSIDTKRCRLSVDGSKGIRMGLGDKIKVTRSKNQANIIMVSDKPFYDTLNEKLINRR